MVVEDLFGVAGRTSTDSGGSAVSQAPTTCTIHSGDVDSNDVDQSRQRPASECLQRQQTHGPVLER